MNRLLTNISKYFHPALLSLIPLLLYILVLSVRISSEFSKFFHSYSHLLLLFVLTIYYLCFQLQNRFRWVVVLSVIAILFALPLSYLWTSGFSDNSILGGLLPYKDGFYYYNGARTILAGELLGTNSLLAAMRPLFPAFLSSILLLTSQNLQISLAILVGLTGLSCFFAAQLIHQRLGSLAAAVYFTLIYLFIQPLIGDTVTEMLGLTFGSLAFVVLWLAAKSLNLRMIVIGLIILMVAVSVRPGAFFVFPLIAIWAIWVFRKDTASLIKICMIVVGTIFLSFIFLNWIFVKLLVEPGVSANSNFAYTIYGQVLGGAGYHSAVENLNTRNPSIVYQAALRVFLDHPFSFIIAAAKSYRDFFLPSRIGILPIHSTSEGYKLGIIVWVVSIIILFRGIYYSIKNIRSPVSSLLIAVFIGILLSIPFLPPIDGGRRFYVSTIPFFFALLAVGLQKPVTTHESQKSAYKTAQIKFVYITSAILGLLMIPLPILVQKTSSQPVISTPSCGSEQVPFAVKVNSGSYVDLYVDKSDFCGFAPRVCLSDFESNGAEKKVDTFFQSLVDNAQKRESSTRILPANNIINGKFTFFVAPTNRLISTSSSLIIAGCAWEKKSPNTLYVVTSEYPIIRE